MKFVCLNGREIKLNIVPDKYPVRSREQSKSLGQYRLGCLLRSIYGLNAIILEEFSLPEERLVLDFYIPHFNIAFEYQGKQHDQFSKFFHGDKSGFERSQERDTRKKEWCQLNKIMLIEVRGPMTRDELMDTIESARINDERSC